MRFLLFLCLALAACELQEVTITESENVLVAEITLRAGDPFQRALLHRTLANGSSAPVPSAQIRVTNAAGSVMTFEESNTGACLARDDRTVASCYISNTPGFEVLPAQTYTLRIETADGRVLTAATRVPDDFRLLRPAGAVCSLPPNTRLPVTWTVSQSAWVYVSETLIYNLEPYLGTLGIELKESPLRAFGLSLSNQDTTVVFPTELGLFQRFDADLTQALAAIQNGLPPNTHAEVIVAAADRNYVNWERGGNFNPSGLIRVPSIRGDGTGTFGSLVPKKFTIVVGRPAPADC